MQLLCLSCLFYSLLFVYRGGCIGSSDSSAIPKLMYKVNNQTISKHYTLGCTDNETQTLACLNGGVCFIYVVDAKDRIARCACYTKYIGNRCEMIDPKIYLKQVSREKKVIYRLIPGLTALIVFVLIVGLTVIYIRRIERNNSYILHRKTSGTTTKLF